MSKAKTKSPAQARKEAEDKLAALVATAESKAMERTVALLESPQPVAVPWQDYPQFDDFNRWPTAYGDNYLWSNLDDRVGDRYRPLYETANDLRLIRAAGRRFKAFFPIAIGALEALTNYVIGPGYEFNVRAKRGSGLESLALAVQSVVDRFLDRNDFIGCLDREIHQNTREDGEQLIALYPDGADKREVRIELVGPEFISPPGKSRREIEQWRKTTHQLNYWNHGVHTVFNPRLKRDDVARPLGYHVVFDTEGEQWDYIPACCSEFIKRNVGRNGRRGISDFHAVCGDLERESKIRRNTAEGAAILAAIVMIYHHAPGTTRRSVESMISENAVTSYEKPIQDGTRSQNVSSAAPGTIKHVPNGMQPMLGALGELRSPVYIEVAQYVLRILGSRWNMPEYLISGDASNANYASTLVAGMPFVRAREADQAFYGHHFVSLIWKALRMYYEAGEFRGIAWDQLRNGLEVDANYATPATTDRNQMADADKKLSDLGVKSKRSIAADHGLDHDEEQANLASEPQAPAPAMPPVFNIQKLESLAERALARLAE